MQPSPARWSSFAYDAQGFLSSITDPENHTTTYTYDPVGRMTGSNRPDGSAVGFTYDQNGNMTVLTNPSAIDHGFGYNMVNLKNAYWTPLRAVTATYTTKTGGLSGQTFPKESRPTTSMTRPDSRRYKHRKETLISHIFAAQRWDQLPMEQIQ